MSKKEVDRYSLMMRYVEDNQLDDQIGKLLGLNIEQKIKLVTWRKSRYEAAIQRKNQGTCSTGAPVSDT